MALRIRALYVSVLLLAVFCTWGYAEGATGDRTRIMDNVTIFFPEEFPTSIFSFLLQTEEFEVSMSRSIQIIWSGEEDVQSVTFSILIPPGIQSSPGIILERVEGSYLHQVTVFRSEESSSWLNLSSTRDEQGALIYRQSPEALFGRAQLRWSVDKLAGVNVPVHSTVGIRVPQGAKIRYSSLYPSAIQGNLYSFAARSGFIYVESLQTKDATIQLLLMIVATTVVVVVLGSSGKVQVLRKNILQAQNKRFAGIGLPHVLGIFVLLYLLTLGLSYLAGPSPRVNVAAIIGPKGGYVLELDQGPTNVVRTSERGLELMLRFGALDAIVIDDYKFSEKGGLRWRNNLESALREGIPVYVGKTTKDLNADFLVDLDLQDLPSSGQKEYLEADLAELEQEKKQQNRLGLGWKAFKPMIIIIVIISLFTITAAALAAGYLTFYFRERLTGSVNRLALCILSFFLFFVLGVVLYTISSYFLNMPLGWHGPTGRGITAISVVSTAFGGGNFPRAFFALLGLGAVFLLFVSRLKARISFSLVALFGLLVLFLFVSTPLTAPTLFRVISGETSNTPPKDYFSRSSMNSLISLEYQAHESVAGVFMAIVGSDSIETWLSRGMIASLAFAGAFFVLARNSGRTNALVIPGLFLVISRLFARVGDLQISKSIWTLPTALVLATIIVLVMRLVDILMSDLSSFLERGADRIIYFTGFVIVPLAIGFAVLYDAAGTDRLLQVLIGWFLLILAAISARNPWDWPSIFHREVIH